MECVVIISDEEDNEEEKFKADLALAKRLSLQDQDHVQKKAKPTKEKPTQELHSAIKIKSFVKRFKNIKFDPSSYCSSSCSQIVKEETIEDQPPCKMMKLEGGGQEPVTEFRVDQEIVYELISDDELPDLEEGEPGGTLSRTTQTRPGGEVKSELELFSPESPTPESQWCSSPLGLNVEPIRVPLYEDVSSEEDNEPMFEDISSDSDYCKDEDNKGNESSVIILSEEEDNQTVVISSSDQSLQKTPQKFVHHQDSPFKQTVKQEGLSSLPSPSVPSSSGVESLFNGDTKRKLANILKRVGSTKSLTSINNSSCNSSPSRTNSSNSLCSSVNQSERHFLDVLDSGVSRTKETCSETLNDRKQSVAVEDEIIKPDVKLGQPQRRRKIRVRRKTDEAASSSKTLYEEKPSLSNSFSVMEVLKPLRINIMTDDVDITLCQAMSNLHVNTVNSCFEEGTDFLDQGLQFIHDYLESHRIPQSMFKDIVMRGLLGSRDTQLMLKSYKIILLIHEKHPEVFSELDWDFLKLFMDELSIGRGLWNQEPLILHMVGLFLKVFVRSFEEELYRVDFKDPKAIRQTSVYKTISYDSGYLNLKELVNWIRCSITSGEYPEVQDTVYLGHLEPDINVGDAHLQRSEIPKILPLLQRLLSLGISVSSSPLECAKLISSELLKTYIYLTSVKQKRLLIETISSNVLRFRLISLVLLKDSFLGVDFPQDLQTIYECYYCAPPPRYFPLTPPTTPQSDDENEGTVPQVEHYSPVQVEELAMILYYVTQSYLQCKKRKGHNVLRRKSIMRKEELNSLSSEDERDLRQLPARVEELRGHLLTLTGDLTEATDLYLNLMMCLS